MARRSRYSPEVKERAVRMVLDQLNRPGFPGDSNS